MDDDLLVRTYDVGFGDCIYVQIPDGKDSFHMLIDCGTSDPAERLEAAVDDVRADLPAGGWQEAPRPAGRRPILTPITSKVSIPPGSRMSPSGASGCPSLSSRITPRPTRCGPSRTWPTTPRTGCWSGAGWRWPLVCSRCWRGAPGINPERSSAARGPGSSQRHPSRLSAVRGPRRGSGPARPADPDKRKDYDLTFEQGTTCFRGFQEKDTCLRVLAPEWDIDKYYLGQGSFDSNSLVDQYLFQTDAYKATSETFDQAGPAAVEAQGAPATEPDQPFNISAHDFRLLRSRLLYSGLAFSQKDDRAQEQHQRRPAPGVAWPAAALRQATPSGRAQASGRRVATAPGT